MEPWFKPVVDAVCEVLNKTPEPQTQVEKKLLQYRIEDALRHCCVLRLCGSWWFKADFTECTRIELQVRRYEVSGPYSSLVIKREPARQEPQPEASVRLLPFV